MKRFSWLFSVTALCAVTLVFMTGCALFESPSKSFVTGVDAGLNMSHLLDQYDKYVDADATLQADSKKIRKQTSASLRKLVADAGGSPVPASPPPAPPPK